MDVSQRCPAEPVSRQEPDASRIAYFDWLNVLACFSVVVLHVNGSFWSFADNSRWLGNLVVESVFYPAVAIFFMLTGATLLDYRSRYDTATYFRKRLTRVGVPFLAWSLLAIAFHVLKGQLTLEQLTPANLISWIVNCDYYNVYWFFAPMFACYLAIPVLGAIPKEKRDRVYLYAFLYAFVTIALLPMAARWLGVPWNAEWQTPVSGGYLMYVLLGYLLTRHPLPRWARLVSYVLAVGALVLRMVATYRLSAAAGMVIYPYGGYINFPCVLQAVAVFTLFQRLRLPKGQRVTKTMRWLASASFSVYLSHKFIMDVLERFALEPAWLSGGIGHSLLWPFVVYGLAIGVYAIGSRIPVVRKIFFQ